jgi:hypothetical protein
MSVRGLQNQFQVSKPKLIQGLQTQQGLSKVSSRLAKPVQCLQKIFEVTN